VKRFTFQKTERLCSHNLIEGLFTSGESFLVYPLKIVFSVSKTTEQPAVQAAFTASKRNFKKAVSRNVLKRRMREAYRLNKVNLYTAMEETDLSVTMMFMYIATEILDFITIEKAMIGALKKLPNKIEKFKEVE
jgi:ribonuclease P protein component